MRTETMNLRSSLEARAIRPPSGFIPRSSGDSRYWMERTSYWESVVAYWEMKAHQSTGEAAPGVAAFAAEMAGRARVLRDIALDDMRLAKAYGS